MKFLGVDPLSFLRSLQKGNRWPGFIPHAAGSNQPLQWQIFAPPLNILHRSNIVADRNPFEHWKCDLIQFREKSRKANVTSLVERVSHFIIFLRNKDRQSGLVMSEHIQVLPHLVRRLITFDRSREFTD